MNFRIDVAEALPSGARSIREEEPFLNISQGAISIREPGSLSAATCGPRCAVTVQQELVCTFMVQRSLGTNDFCPILARSFDAGITWKEQGAIWPELRQRFSIFGSVSASSDGDLFFFGTRTAVEREGEPFWCESLQAMKANELFYARSSDSGYSWSDPIPITMPFPAAAEAAGAICIARSGAWHACYCPYNTFDPELKVQRNQVVLLSRSPSDGIWQSSVMLQFDDELAAGAEAWVVELADGSLLGTCWNVNLRDGSDYPNAYAISYDGGRSWSATRSTNILGQACALAPLPNGSALFVYNQRKHGRIGVWLAQVLPSAEDFGIQFNELVWEFPHSSPHNGYSTWRNFTFGEPSVTLLPDGQVLVAFWCVEDGISSIRYVKLAFPTKRNPLPPTDKGKLRV